MNQDETAAGGIDASTAADYSCYPAVQKAKEYYTQVNGCYFCSNDCHTS